MSSDLLTQLADYGADHEERQPPVTADEILGTVVPVPVHTTRPLPVRRVAVVLVAAAVVALVVALPLLFARSDAPPADSSTVPSTPTTTMQPTSTTVIAPPPEQASIRSLIVAYRELTDTFEERQAATAAGEALEAAINSTFVSYIDAVNADDMEAAFAATERLNAGSGAIEVGRLRNQTDFLIELGWDYKLDTCLNRSLPEGEVICRLAVSSPLHEALGIDASDSFDVGDVGLVDAVWTTPYPWNPAPELTVSFDVRVIDALGMVSHDQAALDEFCPYDPRSAGPDDFHVFFAEWGTFVLTGECGAYLNSITDEVVAAVEEAAIASYIDAVNTADLDAAAAAFELLDARFDAPKTSERLWNLTEFMIELGWDFTIEECLATIPEIAEVACGLVVSSPVHEALGIDSVDIYRGDFSMDAIWTNIRRAIPVILFIDNRVESAYGSWISRNDPDTSDGTCAPDAKGNHDGLRDLSSDLAPADYSFFAYWDVFIYTGECGAYLNSITPQVVASIETTDG